MTLTLADLEGLHLDEGNHDTRDALKPTVETLQASALDLFDAMINPAAGS
jgi:hypothetical protein